MRSLFARIFLWFWLAMVVVAAILIFSSPFFTRSRAGLERWQRGVEEHLGQRVEEVAVRVAGGEVWPFEIEHRRERPPPPVFVLRADGSSPDGIEPPPDVARLARRVASSGEAVSERSGMFHMVGRLTAGVDGSSLVVVAAARRPPRMVDLLDPAGLSWRLALLTALVGIVCFWLARQLAAPVAGLQVAARQLAAGDLAARATPHIASRRDEIGVLARDFNTMAERVEMLVSAQQRLVRDVSHELRSPLARIRVAAELARQRAGPEATGVLDRLEAEADCLEHLIGQLLALSRLDTAAPAGEAESIDLGELVAAIAEDAGFEASARGVRVLVEASAPVSVCGQRQVLRSAIENVVRNAIACTANGSEVLIRVEASSDEAVVSVSDRGPGVPEGELAAVFEPFYRVEHARERGRGGAGLGLAITARAVALHGGSVEARNRPEGGLEVELRLPASAAC